MDRPTKKHQKKTKQNNSSGFLPFALFVFSALAVGLIIILMRSQA